MALRVGLSGVSASQARLTSGKCGCYNYRRGTFLGNLDPDCYFWSRWNGGFPLEQLQAVFHLFVVQVSYRSLVFMWEEVLGDG